MTDALSDSEVQRILGQRVASGVLGADGSSVEIGPLTANYYSFTFSVTASAPSGKRSVFVKVPKGDMRGRVLSVLPITSEDRRLAKEEEASLRLLGQKWDGADLAVHWIKLLGVIPEYNALVTDRAFACDAFTVFRRLDLRRRLGFRGDARRLEELMVRLGAGLRRFHQANAKTTVYRLSDELPKFEHYCRALSAATRSPWPNRIMELLRSITDAKYEGVEVPTFKGLDLRNVLIDSKDAIYLLDPGKTKFTHREADIARFVMTYRILYWGSRILPLVRTPSAAAEESFLNAYYGGSRPSSQLLSLFLLKEQLKHWHTALDSLRLRAWSPMMTRIVENVYVNPFYSKQIEAQLQLIERIKEQRNHD